MNGRLLAAAVACAALALPASALGKGATEARMEGDGIDGAIVFPSSGPRFEALAQGTGFYAAVFGPRDPREPGRPKRDLGPKYTVTYTMPEMDGGADTITQYLYPYASGGRPVTYTPPNQPYFDGQRTVGGWVRGHSDLKAVLIEAGLPPTAAAASTPPNAGSSGSDMPWRALTGLGVSVLALAAVSRLLVRRRTHTTAASASSSGEPT